VLNEVEHGSGLFGISKYISMRIAVIGTGAAGLACIDRLKGAHEVWAFEQEVTPGGHAKTVTVELEDKSIPVDTGFMVFNSRNYPLFCRLLERKAIAPQPSDMSFSVTDTTGGVTWRGTSIASIFAQPRNALRRDFWAMLADILRFHRLGTRNLGKSSSTLAEMLSGRHWSKKFLEWYLVPLGSAIWSSAPEAFLQMPAELVTSFFLRHGLLSLGEHPDWKTIPGGSRRYVEAILKPLAEDGRLLLNTPVKRITRKAHAVELHTDEGTKEFDHVVLACHSDQSLGLLSDPTELETKILGAISYRHNQATLHLDERLLPPVPRARASWNYILGLGDPGTPRLTYDLSRLQRLPTRQPILESLNLDQYIDESKVLARLEFSHPVLDSTAIAARKATSELVNQAVSRPGLPGTRTWYCGAWWGDGFHEDAMRSGTLVATMLSGRLP
jgi:predicted NAD/FAD-binding protein